MLIDKGFSMGDVVSIKLTNGDELIARFEEYLGNEIKISKPLLVTISTQGLGMIHWMFLGDKDTVSIDKMHILAMMPSKKDAADQYLQSTTGIALK